MARDGHQHQEEAARRADSPVPGPPAVGLARGGEGPRGAPAPPRRPPSERRGSRGPQPRQECVTPETAARPRTAEAAARPFFPGAAVPRTLSAAPACARGHRPHRCPLAGAADRLQAFPEALGATSTRLRTTAPEADLQSATRGVKVAKGFKIDYCRRQVLKGTTTTLASLAQCLERQSAD